MTQPSSLETIALGDPGTLLFENDRVRIWELIMKPGETCNWHVHEHDHLLVVFEGASIEAWRTDGSTVKLEIPDHQVLYIPRTEQPEIARNASPSRTLRELIIDLKDEHAEPTARALMRFFQPGTASTSRLLPEAAP
jgi:quercetin dioxygenase-like cupin family protein